MLIGIDIGGTHTDAVLVSKGKMVRAFKTATTRPLEEGVKKALIEIGHLDELKAVHVGTTHATNALLEGKNLFRTGVIRLAGHRPDALKPCAGWPLFLKEKIFAGVETVDGGWECDLRAITMLNPAQIKDASEKLAAAGVESLAIVGVFSPILSEQEEMAAAAVREVLGEEFPITLSSEIGGIGFIERENASILNASLKKPMREGFERLKETLTALGVNAPLHLTQNNGSVIDLKRAIEYPLLTVSSGPTNSFIGASRLAGLSDAIVVDIGGTSTDIGCVKNGFPRRSIHNVSFGGVALNFRAPDVLALPIGGGSYLDGRRIGPESCGGALRTQAQVFGGEFLTLTDAACVAGVMSIPGAEVSRVCLSTIEAQNLIATVRSQVASGVEKMRGGRKDLPVIAVGGGAAIASAFQPEHQAVANAYGAALAEVSATIDTVLSLSDRGKQLEDLKDQALQLAVDEGASSSSVRIVDLQVIPYHYVPNQLARVIATASG
ncbi:putative Hydantoinase/oxoprolinase protein family [Waddlia chondrophila 2032/99]|nr:putative Hydantoinase/oxoprolinase protein family [Waddlia chondrophila 2032/99]